jgi:hypothetical protein
MLTPMLVQYVVGLCCLRCNPDAVDVTVGDLVLDVAARKRRDVDVTVTLNEADGTVRAFKAYEVKREGEPLDVTTVEQLCIKLRDMPAITHRAIVSASDFTDGAMAKAEAHNVELFVLKPWTEPLAKQFSQFPNTGPPAEFISQITSCLLLWANWRLDLHALEGPPSFCYENSAPLFAADGTFHKKYPTLEAYREDLLLRSTEILFKLDPAQTIWRTFPVEQMASIEDYEASPAWPHTHTIGVVEDQVFLKLATGLANLHAVTIAGQLQWRRRKRVPEFLILERVPTGDVFAGAAVADMWRPEGKMLGMVFSPDSRNIDFHMFQLQEKHRNAIRQLKIPLLS